MKAILKEPNSPVKLANLPEPSFSSSNDSENIIVQVKFVGICRTDIFVANGAIPVHSPIILGHEFSGVVIEAGTKSGFMPSDRVVINPLYGSKFMGMHFDGALCEYIKVPAKQAYLIPETLDYKTAAYTEPVAASMSVLNAGLPMELKGAIYGNNRIAELTSIIMKSFGYNIKNISDADSREKYDYIIETEINSRILSNILNRLKSGGTLVVKTRTNEPVSFIPGELVAKNITLKAVNYSDFNTAIDWLARNKDNIKHLFGNEYSIEQIEKAIEDSDDCSKKIFIKISD